MIRQFTCLVLSLLCACTCAFAQNTVAPQIVNISGGTNDDPTSYYRYEWSVGESAVIQTLTSSTLTVTAGILQPQTNLPSGSNGSGQWGTEEIKVFPNPVVTELEVSILSKQKGKVNMLLYDASGRLMGTKVFDYYGTGQITKWNFSPMASGSYTIKITLEPFTGSTGKKGSFQVIKLNN